MHPTAYITAITVALFSAAAWIIVGVFKQDMSPWLRLATVIAGAFAIALLLQRDTYLPFLGYTVYPTQTLQITPLLANANASVKLTGLPPKHKIVWWASKPDVRAASAATVGDIKHAKDAYAATTNAGVVMTDAHGTVVIHLWCPQTYKVNRMGFDRVLPKHIHYRIEQGVAGHDTFLSRVFTAPVECDETR